MGENNSLVRTLGLKEIITMTTGQVVGVGLFTLGAQCVGMTGPGIIFYTIISLLIVIWPARMYGEMGAMLPYAGGTYEFARYAINKPVANIASWHYYVAVVGTVAAEALAFANYFGYIMDGLGIPWHVDVRITACVLIVLFALINYRGVQFSGRWQNGFVAFFWAASLIWMIYMIANLDFSNFAPEYIAEFPGFKAGVMMVVYVWWCYGGFEIGVSLGGEVRFPQINIPRALRLVPFIIFSVTALWQFFLIGVVPADLIPGLAEAEAPFAEGLTLAGFIGFPLIFLCIAVAFGGDFSTLNPGIACSSRYMYRMGDDRVLPSFFAKVHPTHKTPYIAIIVSAIIILILISTGSIVFVSLISCFSLFWTYIIGMIAFICLRKKYPDKERPYKVKAGMVGAVVSIIVYIFMGWAVGLENFLWSCIITAACLLVYFVYSRRHALDDEELKAQRAMEDKKLAEDQPTEDDMRTLNRQWKVWRIGTIIATTIAILLYVIAILIN